MRSRMFSINFFNDKRASLYVKNMSSDSFLALELHFTFRKTSTYNYQKALFYNEHIHKLDREKKIEILIVNCGKFSNI